MRDPLDIARNAAEHAIAAGTREDAEHPAMEYHWLRRAQAFALISIGESLREIIEWASLGDEPEPEIIKRQPEPRPRVQMTVTGNCGHIIGTWIDAIEEKYPFYCVECGETIHEGKYPWVLATELVPGEPPAVKPQPAEPLVMCGEPDGDSERCVLLPGHEGGHMAYFATGPTSGPLPEFQP